MTKYLHVFISAGKLNPGSWSLLTCSVSMLLEQGGGCCWGATPMVPVHAITVITWAVALKSASNSCSCQWGCVNICRSFSCWMKIRLSYSH